MPHPQSPLQPSSTSIAGSCRNFLPSRDPFCASVPVHSQGPLSSAASRPSVISTTLSTAVPSSMSSREPRLPPSLMDLDDATSLHWSAHCGLPVSQEVTSCHIPSQYGSESASVFDYSQNSLPYTENYNMSYSPHDLGASCPRSYTAGLDLAGLPSSMNMSDAYPPSAYQIEPSNAQEVVSLSDRDISSHILQPQDDYDHQYATDIKVEDHGGYGSPYGSDTIPCSTPHDDTLLHPHDLKNECGREENPIDKELPYAQLIYRALLEQPGHTMILRDIYNWFKENTDKAADKETKGWQNSIRHNLSMNGAFEKVDQPCEEAKKGFMWRLTDEAILGGVKSTTRYRSKQPNKRGNRSLHPLPQRQASGAKGGQAARRSAKIRRSNVMNDTHRNDPYMSRSVPASYDPHFNPRSTDITTAHALPSMPYAHSPYYNSDSNYTDIQDNLESPLGLPRLDPFPVRSYTASPLSQGCQDSAYVLYQDPSEPLFSNSPSPSADDPLTPMSPGVDWGMDMSGLLGGPCIFDEQPYRELM